MSTAVVLGHEREAPRGEEECQDAEGPPVHFVIVRLATEELRRYETILRMLMTNQKGN